MKNYIQDKYLKGNCALAIIGVCVKGAGVVQMSSVGFILKKGLCCMSLSHIFPDIPCHESSPEFTTKYTWYVHL